MIFFWRRRILLVTYSLNERVRVCSVLSANGIEYEVDVRNMAARQQGWAGMLGINMSAATEYRISVDKDDYDQACYVVNQRR